MKTHFYLDKVQKNGNACILLYVSINGRRIKVTTKESVSSKIWDIKNERIKKSASGALEINRRLDLLEERAQKLCRDARDIHHIEPTALYIKKHLFEDNQKKITLIQRFENFITSLSSKRKIGTIASYKETLAHIKEFQKKSFKIFTFDTIDLMFYDEFVNYLINKNCNNNTVAKHIKVLKTFLNYSVEHGYTQNLSFKKFKVVKHNPDLIYLTQDELNEISKVDLKGLSPTYLAVRDTFLLQCYTGLRYSDLKKIKPENIKDNYLEIQTLKTKDSLKIPLIISAKEILLRIKNGELNAINAQVTNRYLKTIARMAKINELIQIVTYKGIERIEKTLPKYNLIATHTGRRTFVTLSLEKGMRPEVIMRITGHKDMKSFQRYIRLTDKIAEIELLRAWEP